MRAFLAALLIVIATQPVAAATTWSPVERDFVRIPPPSAADLAAAAVGTRSWYVRFEGKALQISDETPTQTSLPFEADIDASTMGYRGTTPSQVVHVPGAWFAAYDYGEFGGGLWQFSGGGTVARRLLTTETWGLMADGNEVLAATGPSMLGGPMRIHRFAFQNGSWLEIEHVDFPKNTRRLVKVGRDVYGMSTLNYNALGLVRVDFAGSLRTIASIPSDVRITNLAPSASGDFAIGAQGYVLRLDVTSGRATALWYAPRDCVTYTHVQGDRYEAHARCAGAPGTRSFVRRQSAPIVLPLTSPDGNWMAQYWGGPLLHLADENKTTTIQGPPTDSFYQQLSLLNSDPVLSTIDAVWLRRDGRWSKLATGWCAHLVIAGDVAWCVRQDNERTDVTGTHSDGKVVTAALPPTADNLIQPGLSSDIWLTDKTMAQLYRVDATGAVTKVSLTSAAQSISVGSNAVWFSEADGTHYGYVDQSGGVHEFEWLRNSPVLSIRAARSGAWLEERFVGNRIFMRHVSGSGAADYGNYVTDVRAWTVSRDGTLWAQSGLFPKIMRLTEDGALAQYRVPCSDPHIVIFRGRNNGLWFYGFGKKCRGFISERGVQLRSFPLIEQIVYK